MTKDQLEQIVLGSIDDLTSKEMSDSQAQLIIGFVDNLRQKAADTDQSDHFASELAKKLSEIQDK